MKLKTRIIQSLWNGDYQESPMACPEIVIPNVTEALYGNLLQKLTASGGKFNGNEASIEGCTFDWNWDQAAETLHITCTKKPFFATCDLVESKISALIEKSKMEAI